VQKEQAEGDYQNFVCVLMRERGLSLQGAVDTLTGMIAGRVQEYARLRASLPSFGASADYHLGRYLGDIEHETYGFIRWCYESKRQSAGLEIMLILTKIDFQDTGAGTWNFTRTSSFISSRPKLSMVLLEMSAYITH
jgi:hypothetical protein